MWMADACAWMCAKSLQSCLTLCDPMDQSQPGSSAHGILQARILEWVPMPSRRGSSLPRNWTCISYVYLHWQTGSLPLVKPGKPPVHVGTIENPFLHQYNENILEKGHVLSSNLTVLSQDLIQQKSLRGLMKLQIPGPQHRITERESWAPGPRNLNY